MGGYALPLPKLALPRITLNSFSFIFPISAIHLRHRHSISGSRSTLFCSRQVKANAELSSTSVPPQDIEPEEEESIQVLTVTRSDYNDIAVVDTPKSRVLLLDSSRNIHSILYKETKWTEAYWDEFASLPPLVPEGPIAILGLGAATSVHLMLDMWPSLQIEGWDIDPMLIDIAREYFGLSDLEKPTKDGGILNVHIGDVFIPSENLRGKYAGIVVDLFAEGKVLPQLLEENTWLELSDRLMPGGRIMANCGGLDGGADAPDDESIDSESLIWLQNPALKALSTAFPGQLNWKRMPKENGANFLALTGPLPDLESWSVSLPSPLSSNVKHWRPCMPIRKEDMLTVLAGIVKVLLVVKRLKKG